MQAFDLTNYISLTSEQSETSETLSRVYQIMQMHGHIVCHCSSMCYIYIMLVELDHIHFWDIQFFLTGKVVVSLICLQKGFEGNAARED